jgi:hypothetical protein
MADLKVAIARLRESTAAILRLGLSQQETTEPRNVSSASYEYGWGSAFAVISDKYLVTAFHVLNNGLPRDPNAKFYAFMVPGNGGPVVPFPVVAFPIERQDLDIAVLEIAPCSTAGNHLVGLPVSFAPQSDGTRVLTMGFPGPKIHALNVNTEGSFLGGQFFLKSHANEGIVAAQYPLDVTGAPRTFPFYELNVMWHHGESGGAIAIADDEPVVFSVMQHYRDIQSPHGVFAGPHRGVALSAIQQELEDLGVVGV